MEGAKGQLFARKDRRMDKKRINLSQANHFKI